MCFSATASFGASIALSLIGTKTFVEAKNPSQKAFAAIPMLFASQQIMEGFIWLSFTNPDFLLWRQSGAYAFLIFAQVIWPSWVPVSIMLMEKDKNKLKALRLLSVLGGIVSIYLAYSLFAFPIVVEAGNYHITYKMYFPQSAVNDGGISYILVTILPPLITSTKKVWMFGAALLISFLTTKIFYTEYLVSVWCFFAAITSGIIYFIIFYINKDAVSPVSHYTSAKPAITSPNSP